MLFRKKYKRKTINKVRNIPNNRKVDKAYLPAT